MAWLFSWIEGYSTLTEQLIAVSLKGVLVLIAATAVCFALRHASAAARHFVWMLAISGLLALPVLSFGLPVWQVSILPSVSPKSAAIAADAPEVIASAPNLTLSPVVAEPLSAGNEQAMVIRGSKAVDFKADSTASQMPGSTAGWVRWGVALWLAGVLLIIGRLLIGTASIWWIASRASRITDSTWLSAAEDIAWQIGLTREVQLLRTPRVTMPVTCGLIRSSILLPADADEWPDERRQVVLVHELAHVKRWDCLTQMFAQIACSVYWFNPLVWLATRQLRIERERACDDQVIDVGTKASEYAGHLLEMARTFRSSRCSSLAAVAIARRSELEGRLLAILDPALERRGLNRPAAISVGAIIVFMVLPLATLRLSAKAHANNLAAAESLFATGTEPAYRSAVRQDSQNIQPEQRQPVGRIALGSDDSGLAHSEAGPEGQQATEPPGSIQQKENSGAIEALREALKDEDPEVRQHALFALTQIDPNAAGVLIEALKDQNWQIRAKAAYGLGLRGRQKGIDALVGALSDTSWQVREQAAWGLGLIGDARAIEPLVVALRDEKSDVREKAAWALGLKGDKRTVEPLMAALKDTSARVRGMAAWALGLKGDPRAASALKDALKDPDKQVRQKAAWALGMLLMQRGEAFVGDQDSKDDNEVQADREGKVRGGVSGGVSGGISGGISRGVSEGISEGVSVGVAGGVAGGVLGGVPSGGSSGISGGVGGGVGIGVGAGVTGGVTGGVRTENGTRIKKKSKPKTK